MKKSKAEAEIDVWKEGPNGLLDEGWWASVIVHGSYKRLGPFGSKKAARTAVRAESQAGKAAERPRERKKTRASLLSRVQRPGAR